MIMPNLKGQQGIKTGRQNMNKLRHIGHTVLIAESWRDVQGLVNIDDVESRKKCV